jgi:hypothetical protein
MERGLLWLPLLAVFIWLAWAGWNEYQKVQVYETWASGFERSKYDILAVLGQSGEMLTWGRPTRQGPKNLKTISLRDIDTLHLIVNGQAASADEPPKPGQRSQIVLRLKGGESLSIPFTDSELASQWEKALHQSLLELKSAST